VSCHIPRCSSAVVMLAITSSIAVTIAEMTIRLHGQYLVSYPSACEWVSVCGLVCFIHSSIQSFFLSFFLCIQSVSQLVFSRPVMGSTGSTWCRTRVGLSGSAYSYAGRCVSFIQSVSQSVSRHVILVGSRTSYATTQSCLTQSCQHQSRCASQSASRCILGSGLPCIRFHKGVLE
jgi:hypothetical protein